MIGGHSSKTDPGRKGLDHPRMRSWMLLIPVGVVMLVAHSVVMYYVLSHTAMSAAVLSGVIVLIAIKHVGLLGPLYALLSRRPRR
jgi:membrane protein YdbS with pleckstrin-like domain